MFHLKRLLVLKVCRIAKRVECGHSTLGHSQVLHAASKPLTNLDIIREKNVFEASQITSVLHCYRHELPVDAKTPTELLQVVSTEVESANLIKVISVFSLENQVAFQNVWYMSSYCT